MDRDKRPAAWRADRAPGEPHELAIGRIVAQARLDRDALRLALLERLPAFVRGHVSPDTPVREFGNEIRVGRKGSLSIVRLTGTFFDHETAKGGDVFDLVRVLTGTREFPDTLRRVAEFTGTTESRSIPVSRPCSTARPNSRDTRAIAHNVWKATRPIVGTVATAYLDARGVGYVAGAPALRFHPGITHRNAPGRRFPALVAGVQDAGGEFLGIQRTYLDGARKADLDPVRASLGSIAGGAVRLAPVLDDTVLVGEGVESTAAAMKVLEWPGGAWATLGTSGLRAVVLPESVRRVLIAADRDDNGAGQKAAAALARRMQAEGRRVECWLPSIHRDFNDELMAMEGA